MSKNAKIVMGLVLFAIGMVGMFVVIIVGTQNVQPYDSPIIALPVFVFAGIIVCATITGGGVVLFTNGMQQT